MTDPSSEPKQPSAPIKVKKSAEQPVKVKRTHAPPKQAEWRKRRSPPKMVVAGKERYREAVKSESERLLRDDALMNPRRPLFLLLGGLFLAAFVTALFLARRTPPSDVRVIADGLRAAGVPYIVNYVHIDDVLFRLYAVDALDLTPVRDLPIQALMLKNRQTSDLTPLRGMTNLLALVAGYSQVSDLTPLRGLNLQHLDLRGTPVSDLSPLDGLPLVTIGFTETTATNGVDVLRRIPSLKLINKRPPDRFWAAYDAARRPPGKSWREILEELEEMPDPDEEEAPNKEPRPPPDATNGES